MINAIRNRMEREEGFTLIELLVVILIIGILAAIAIPSFLNQRYKGQDACAKSMVKQMQTATETYQTDNNSYGGLSIASLNSIESSISANGGCATGVTNAQKVGTDTAGPSATATAGVGCNGTAPAAGASSYCVSSQSASGNVFGLINNGSVVTRWCNVPGGNNKGACPNGTAGGAAGTW